MLRVNVGLSRKLTQDYNSTGFSLNLEGELSGAINDPETLLAQIQEHFDLAHEGLNLEIERFESDSAIARRDEAPPPAKNGQTKNHAAKPSNGHSAVQRPEPEQPPTNGTSHAASAESATNKQVQYLLNLGKRAGYTPKQLESKIASILGQARGIYDLTKPEAGQVIDNLSNGTPVTNGTGRHQNGR